MYSKQMYLQQADVFTASKNMSASRPELHLSAHICNTFVVLINNAATL
jgi:hypothetical protein